jgi:hypothetical protein
VVTHAHIIVTRPWVPLRSMKAQNFPLMSQVLESPGAGGHGFCDVGRCWVVSHGGFGGRWRRSSGAWRGSSAVAWQTRTSPNLSDRHEDGLMLSLLLETWNHRRSHAVLHTCIRSRKRESCMSAEGSRRTPRNDVGEMLNHSEKSSQPHHETKVGRR